jgi:hypothetical protein
MPSPLFIAVGHRGTILLSEDGAKWHDIEEGEEGETWRAAAFGNGRFVAVGSYGGVNITGSSTDGEDWQTAEKDAKYVTYIRGLAFGNDLFLGMGGDPGAAGDSKPFTTTSTDGLKWSEYAPIGGKNILRRAAYGNNTFVAVGDRGRRAASGDGKEWKDAGEVRAIDTLVDVAFGPTGSGGKGVFAGVGLHGLRMSSVDGVKWTGRQVGEEGEHLNSIVWSGNQFVAVGAGATYTSPDGASWQRHKNADAPLAVACGIIDKKPVFVGASWKGKLLRSGDGITWKRVHEAAHHIEAVAFGEI